MLHGISLEGSVARIALIAVVAVGAHLGVRLVRGVSARLLQFRLASEAKVQTLSGFVSSLVIFSLYFGAIGLALSEMGVSLTAYLASASVIGLAISFGSQGVVQDVITGLTVVVTDLIDVGDMVEIGGQAGIVRSVGMRFTTLVNFAGAEVAVPNRTITNVVAYPRGYVRAFLDIRLPADRERWDETRERVRALAKAAWEQYPGILLLPPAVWDVETTSAGYAHLRIKFRVWPGQGTLVEGAIRRSLVEDLRSFDPSYADWMVAAHFRAPPKDDAPERRLPQPFAVARRRSRSS